MLAVAGVIALVAALAGSGRPAAAAECNLQRPDAVPVGALVAIARSACPCASFASRDAFRSSVRAVADDGVSRRRRRTTG